MVVHDGLRLPAALELAAVSFSYSRMPVVEEMTFRLAAGEMVGLLGPNGAGKSTVLKLASGYLRPVAGRVLIEGRPLSSLGRREVARRIAVVPQDFSVAFAYTVRQIVELGRLPYVGLLGAAGNADRRAVDAALESTGMAHLAERVWSELSGGERQRALISLALAQQTPILLLDEPTAHLDIRHQIEVLELLRQLNSERGVTVLAVLHDLNLAARYFPRLILCRTKLVADGTPAQVLDEGILSRVYQTHVQVGILRGEEYLSVLPPRSLSPSTPAQPAGTGGSRPVHVVAGGGSGELVMRALADAGIEFVAGPLNVGDSDAALAERLAALTIVEPPWAPISEVGLASAREHMAEARAVIICPVPLGKGNVSLLQAAYDARLAGVPVLLFEPRYPSSSPQVEPDSGSALVPVEARDYSGEGVEGYRRLLEAGAVWIGSHAQLLEELDRLPIKDGEHT
jgi:iron complex transport system ATP-binding protein